MNGCTLHAFIAYIFQIHNFLITPEEKNLGCTPSVSRFILPVFLSRQQDTQ